VNADGAADFIEAAGAAADERIVVIDENFEYDFRVTGR
jgi:hypothetical protein